MAQQPSSPHEVPPDKLSADSDHRALLFPTRFAAYAPSGLRTRRASRPVARARERLRVRRHVVRQVVVLEVAGRLSDVVQDLDRAIQLVLADGPRGVVCDISAVRGGVSPDTLEVLAAVGRHVRHWPGTPVCVASPDTRVRQALSAHPLGEHLTVAETLSSAIDAVLATPTVAVARLRIATHPPAHHGVLDFISRTLLEWELSRVIPVANLVVSELVTCALVSTGSDMDLSIAWHLGALRLTVRDGPARTLDQHHSVFDLHQPGLTQVAGLSHAFGVLPTAEGGKFVWAVLDAPRPQPSTHLRPLLTRWPGKGDVR